jgi:hypothetical protein
VSPFAVAARCDEPGAAKIGQVPRNLWLIIPENLNARTDAQFLIAQQVNQPQACVVCQGFEQDFEVVVHLKPDYDLKCEVVSSRNGATAKPKAGSASSVAP